MGAMKRGRGTCGMLYAIAIAIPRTNVPLSSSRLSTFLQQPPEKAFNVDAVYNTKWLDLKS